MERLSKTDAESQKSHSKLVPLGRWGEVKEIADATVYLFAETGSFVNGNVLVVDGGAWRTAGPDMGSAWKYPDFFMSGAVVEGVKSAKSSKL